MAMLDLNPSHLRIVLDALATCAPAAEVWAYGSRVTGTAHEGSDLDLILRNSKNPDSAQHNLPALKNAFEESHLPILVDVLDWAHLPESFRREIERVHVILQEPNPVHAE
ncbi:MAG: nucleotidyltransferase family protein [Pyrinomonadaceae bacterium]